MNRIIRTAVFWLPFTLTLLMSGAFFAWELGYIPSLRTLPRPPATQSELFFTTTIVILLALNAGLVAWQSNKGTCPIGTKRATGIAGAIAAITLICPACIALPASLIGIGFFFAFLAPYLPLLRIIAIILLVATAWMLWPAKEDKSMRVKEYGR